MHGTIVSVRTFKVSQHNHTWTVVYVSFWNNDDRCYRTRCRRNIPCPSQEVGVRAIGRPSGAVSRSPYLPSVSNLFQAEIYLCWLISTMKLSWNCQNVTQSVQRLAHVCIWHICNRTNSEHVQIRPVVFAHLVEHAPRKSSIAYTVYCRSITSLCIHKDNTSRQINTAVKEYALYACNQIYNRIMCVLR